MSFDIDLKGQQFAEFQDALLHAFPSYSQLEQMLMFQLNQRLRNITQPEAMTNVVFALLTWAETNGELSALLAGALEANPGSPYLRRFAQQVSLTLDAPQKEVSPLASGAQSQTATSGDTVLPLTKKSTEGSSEMPHPSDHGTPASRPLRVFLCYGASDLSSVRKLYHQLKEAGFQPWLDEEDLLPGEDTAATTRKAVRHSDVVLVCLSSSSVSIAGSLHATMRLALDVAQEKPDGTIFVVPVKLQECEVPDRLEGWQAVNYFEPQGYGRLVRALHARAQQLGAATQNAGQSSVHSDKIDNQPNQHQAPHSGATTAATKIKVLFLAANPSGTVPLKLDEEMRAIKEKVRASAHRDLIEIVWEVAVRPDDLLQALNEHKPHIVHFSGHGTSTEEIILNDAHGKPKPVSKQALSALFRTLKDNVGVVVLNACYSQPQAEAITEQIPCAIGMSKAIGDRAAIAFSSSFYRAIGFGRTVQEAFDQGVTSLLLEGIPGETTPQLLTRADIKAAEMTLVNPQ